MFRPSQAATTTKINDEEAVLLLETAPHHGMGSRR